ncbi:hypothetical protein AVEN_64262-1 [Araneus ventricosus]|uniref:Uncharacterized protein n=1 Tax=Araneus ventricosus TaxID=182803 RepID=A0A4Y2SDH6_ARAVE|nr:hypothetical protein AVEN_64262-1 [Araneus ventricosus]
MGHYSTKLHPRSLRVKSPSGLSVLQDATLFFRESHQKRRSLRPGLPLFFVSSLPSPRLLGTVRFGTVRLTFRKSFPTSWERRDKALLVAFVE